MSVIEKMSIMGIRSFGPDDTDRQVIEFFKPLTLILGPNGSGKTTIIECLRYVTTGDTPPNTDRGSSFVHDPKIAHEREVKAQVKLQLKDVADKQLIAIRNLVASQKLKKLSLKTLEGTIIRKGPDGQKSSLSSKCAEIDKEMISALGVSKPILNNVIFCHQEESNWPLSEGKALKQKFDEIFAATRYIKALDEIRKIRIEKVKEIGIFKNDLSHLEKNKGKAEELSRDLKKTQTQLAACKDLIKEGDEKLDPITSRINEIASKEHDIANLQGKLASTKELLKVFETDRDKLEKSIKNLFSGNKEELKHIMENFDSLISQKTKQLAKIKKQCTLEKQAHQNFSQNKSRLTENLGKLKTEHQQHLARISSRDKRLCQLNNQFDLGEVFGDGNEPLSERQIQNVMRNWNDKVKATKEDLGTLKHKYEMQENAMQIQIEEVSDAVSKKKQEQESNKKRINNNSNSMESIEMELSQAGALATRQDDLKQNITDTEADLESLKRSINVDAMRKKIAANQSKKNEKDFQLTSLQQEMRQLQTESKLRTEIDFNSKEKANKQDTVNKMLMRHKGTIIHLLGSMPTKNLKADTNKHIEMLNQENFDMMKDMEEKKTKLSSEKTSKEFFVQHLKNKEELLSSHKNKISKVCGNQDFDAGFSELEKTLKGIQDEKGALTGSLYLYNKYVEQLKGTKPCCPLCTRGFQKDAEAKALIKDLQDKLQQVPSQLSTKEKLISDHQKRLNSMLELKPLKEEVTKLSQKEIPELKSKIETSSSNILKLTDEIDELEGALEMKQCDLKMATNMLPDLVLIDQNQKEIERLEKRLSNLTCQLGNADMTRTIITVGDEISALQSEVEQLKKEIETDQSGINDHNDTLIRLNTQLNQLKSDHLEIASRLQKKNSLEDELSKLRAENALLTESLKKVNVDITELEAKKVTLLGQKKNIVKTKESDLEKIRLEIAEQGKVSESIKNLTSDIEKYVNEGRETKLSNLENQISAVNNNIKDKDDVIASLTEEEKELTKDISDQEIKKREYEDNVRLMDLKDDVASYRIKCQKLDSEIGGYNVRGIVSEKRKLLQQESNWTKEKNENEGRKKELVKKESELAAYLQDGMYKDAEQRFHNVLIQQRTTELACEDLNKYYIALDRAVMKYHHLKMEEINKILKELWMNTYCGGDVDYIEIRSNEDESEAGLEKAKRVYNYKVVLIKNTKVIDMRTHCSAGQKVLASLLIRLALAEVFCLNCGILALDEPTTNLDRENISSLAKSLTELVNSRSEQRNFQLIIITHDEDFVELLGRGNVDCFYKVSKDEFYHSKVSKCRLQGLS